MKLYLDNCCFNRPFDDQTQIRILLESEAKLKIQENVRLKKYELIWSYILDYENNKNPFYERKEQIAEWKHYAKKDVKADADYFLTTDDNILRKSSKIKDIKITDPIEFIKKEMS